MTLPNENAIRVLSLLASRAPMSEAEQVGAQACVDQLQDAIKRLVVVEAELAELKKPKEEAKAE